MLSWRPVPEEKRFVRSDSQAWAAKLPEGSHRYPASWLTGRYSWMHDDGPQEPAWHRCGKEAKAVEDMADASYHGDEGSKVKMACWQGGKLANGEEQCDVVIEADAEDLDAKLCSELHLRSRELRRHQIIDRLIFGSTGGGGKKVDKKAAYRKNRRKARAMTRKALRSWRTQQRGLMHKYSRKQLLEALIPAAGVKAVRPKATTKKAEGSSKHEAKAMVTKPQATKTKGRFAELWGFLLCVFVTAPYFLVGLPYFWSQG